MSEYQNKSLHCLFAHLEKAKTKDELKRVCEQLCEEVKFEYYLIGIISYGISLSSPNVSIITNYPDDWFISYFNESMQKHDPVVRYCLENSLPIRWDQLIKMEYYTDPIGEQIMQRAAEVGLRAGISIPLKSPTDEMAIFSLATSENANIEERCDQLISYVHSFSIHLFDNFSRINVASDEDKKGLTAREGECLFWACEGKTTWEISKILDISKRTVIFHLNSATKKLGAANRQHAVAKAIICGLVKPMP